MQLLTILALACTALAKRDPRHVRKDVPPPEIKARAPAPSANWQPPRYPPHPPKPIIPSNPKTRRFAVDGTKIPEVDFDIGESYAGLLPISSAKNASELYFWFFPTDNPEASDEILIWLNGGPGCSSLEGLLQENGPFLWQYGTYKPVKNPYTWKNLTNVVWVEQPAGTGFSQKRGTPSATNEVEVADQFLGFFKNFVDTFDLHNRKVYITGESYAGAYVPYIADAMHNKTDKRYYDVEGILIYDPTVTYGVVADDIPAVPFVDQWSELFNLNKTTMDHLHEKYQSCGYAAFMEKALTYPPTGPLPTPPNVDRSDDSCRLWNEIYSAVMLVNPCWDEYQVATTCPLLWDVLGFPGSFGYSPEGASIYFNRTEVQRAINAPIMEWSECSDGVLDTDDSDPSGLTVLPRVIEKNNRTVIGHGTLDFVLILDGTLMMIQNMTFNGKQGFSTPPSEWSDFYVPYHEELSQSSLAGAGVFGNWHTERGLTFVRTELSGHVIPQYAPSASYRQLEFLLGRISNLGEVSNFSTQKGNYGNGNATMKMF